MYIPSKKFAVILGFWWAVSPLALQGSCLFLSPTAVQVDKSPWASPEEADVNCNIQCPPPYYQRPHIDWSIDVLIHSNHFGYYNFHYFLTLRTRRNKCKADK